MASGIREKEERSKLEVRVQTFRETKREPAVCLLWWLALAVSAACVSAVASEDAKSPPQRPGPRTRAAEEFRVLTRDWGMRPDSPPSAQAHRGRRLLWQGRIYENFRNDVLDAIAHEVKQNGGNKSPLRRNQFGFNIGGPVLIPHLIKNPTNTFFVLSYEGVREYIFRASP
jgi:hypothetical protein